MSLCVFHRLTSSVNPCKESYLVQVHRVVSEVNGAFIKMLPLVAFPPSCWQIDVPLLLSWLQHRSHHQVVPDEELGVDLIRCLVISGDPPKGSYDRVSCVENLTCQFQNPRCHQSLVELRELLRYPNNLTMNTQRYRVCITMDACHQTDSVAWRLVDSSVAQWSLKYLFSNYIVTLSLPIWCSYLKNWIFKCTWCHS